MAVLDIIEPELSRHDRALELTYEVRAWAQVEGRQAQNPLLELDLVCHWIAFLSTTTMTGEGEMKSVMAQQRSNTLVGEGERLTTIHGHRHQGS